MSKSPPTKTALILSQVGVLRSCHYYAQDGARIPLDLLQSLSPLVQIKRDLQKIQIAHQPSLDLEMLADCEAGVIRYAVAQMLGDIESAGSADEKAGGYYHLNAFMRRFRFSPDTYLKAIEADDERQSISGLFKEGAQAFARKSLSRVYDEVPVSAADMAIMRDKGTSPGDRLNALLRSLNYNDYKIAMDALEESGHDFDDPYFVDDIIPANVFNRVALTDDGKEEAKQRQFDRMREDIGTYLRRVEEAPSPREKARCYAELMESLVRHRMTPQKFADIQEIPELGEKMMICFKSGACTFARYHLEGVMANEPLSAEDAMTVQNPEASASDKINALFRNVGKMSVRILNALEDAGFDLERSDWIDDIIPRNTFNQPAGAPLPVLMAK